MIDFSTLLRPYNPWWNDQSNAFDNLPTFHRPIFSTLIEDLESIPQILSITGPRRIGKSTLLYQLIRELVAARINQERLVYNSFDDPALMARHVKVDELIDQLMKQ